MTFRLRLLGGAILERDDGTLLVGRAAQRHRIALLALLACTPGAGLSRDKLIGLLWPESDTERARNLLNVSVYELRKSLGDDALLSAGDELRLNGDAVSSDLADFTAAMEREDHDAAVALYRGPLLDGFFVDDAPELERWTERERARLADAYARALEALAGAAERRGDRRGAAEWWGRRAAHDPYDSRVALLLMQALDAAGHRAGALQHASIHERLLQEELGMPTAPAVRALATIQIKPDTIKVVKSEGVTSADAALIPSATARIMAKRRSKLMARTFPTCARRRNPYRCVPC